MSLANAVIAGAKVWTTIKPFKRWKARRAAKRAARNAEVSSELIPVEGEETSMGLRTSTNAGLAGIVVNILIQVMGLVPMLSDLAASPEFAAGVTAFAMWLVARFSKTPATPGVL